MPDDEVIEAYTQGRMPRRAFIRRLVAGGISLGAAVAYGSALAPAAAAGTRQRPGPKPRRDHHEHHEHHCRDHHDR